MGTGGRRRVRAAIAVLAGACVLAAAGPGAAGARPALKTVVQDDAQLLHTPTEQVAGSLDELKALGVDTLRVTASWSSLTRDADQDRVPPGFDQTEPAAYEQSRWAALDRLVRLAAQRDLEIMLDIAFWAPHWATDDLPGPRARTDLDVDAYGRFASAVARRYSGTFTPPPTVEALPPSQDESFLDQVFGRPAPPPPATASDEGPLPRVALFGVWNEPNHPAFLLPQVDGARPVSPGVYRRMVVAADTAIKGAQGDARVLIGGLASKDAGRKGVAPLRFVRDLACVDTRLRPRTDGDCAGFTKVPGDGFTMHPYSLHTPPDARPSRNHPDDVPLGAIGRLTALLDRLAARGRIASAVRDVWITEYGYETNPPSDDARYGLSDQARFLPWAEYLAWREPRVVAHSQFLLRDLPPAATRQSASERRGFGQWLSGIQFADGRPKPAQAAFAAGVFVRPLKGARARTSGVFGRIRPGRGARQVELQVRRGRGSWRALRSAPSARGRRVVRFRTRSDGTFDRVVARASVVRGARVRARWRSGATGKWTPGPSTTTITRPSPLG